MAYPDSFKERAVALYREEALSAPAVIERLREEHPGLPRYPVEDSIRSWAGVKKNGARKPKGAVGQLHRLYSARDIAEAIAGWRERSRAWAAKGDYMVRMSWNYYYGAYERMIMRDLQSLDSEASRLMEEFDKKMEEGDKDEAYNLRNQISELLKRYETRLTR